jgi:hypothetical protein
MLSSITARTQTRPIYHRDEHGTIRLRAARTTATNCLDGKVQTTLHPLASNPLHRRTLEHENYPIVRRGGGAAADVV